MAGSSSPASAGRQTAKLRGATAWIRSHWPKRAKRILARPVAEVYSRLQKSGLVWKPGKSGGLGSWERLGKRPIGIRVIAQTVEECEHLLETLRAQGYRVVPGSPRPMSAGVGVYGQVFAPKRR